MKEKNDKAPNVSGSFQIVNDHQKEDVKSLKNQHDLDEESLYYARLFMED
ncbi:hypothetical protein V7152_13380 [Neobacillus drentensis]